MLRIHFTGEDLARTTIAPGADPLWEVLISLHRLRGRDAAVLFGDWKRQVLPCVPPSTALLTALAPAKGYSVDFLTPTTPVRTLSAQLEALRRTPQSTLRGDLRLLAQLHPRRRLPAWVGSLADGGTDAVAAVASAAAGYFHSCLGPYWSRIQAQIDRLRISGHRLVADRGWGAVFETLHPSARWSFPVLQLDYPTSGDIDLRGRGLVLQPSFFCLHAPTAFRDPSLAPVLVYPIEHSVGWAATPSGAGRGGGLGSLLGPPDHAFGNLAAGAGTAEPLGP
ncbi:transcriptional regulator [Streptomyces sp. NPDC053079]|uniref:transcriptional regulator n=1 Tax=Streptomyces sp. NPDC053079 TaxID=3365697 RepID=UPI0037D87F44